MTDQQNDQTTTPISIQDDRMPDDPPLPTGATLVDRMRHALAWASASPSFTPGGEARVGWEKIVQPLLDETRDEVTNAHAPNPFAECPVCGSSRVSRLLDDWRESDRAIPIVGCGNPWHYATRSLGDGLSAETIAAAQSEAVAVGPGRTAGPFVDVAMVPVAPGESVVVQIVDPAPGQNRVVIHRSASELGHRPDGRTFTESVCQRCAQMIAYAVRDQIVCGGLAGKG